MKNQVNQKCSTKVGKTIWGVLKIVFFSIGLLLIFMCASDGYWNGRMILAVVCAFASLQCRIKEHGKEER